jgi:hypothetical protein
LRRRPRFLRLAPVARHAIGAGGNRHAVGTGAFTVGPNRRVPVNTAINAAAFHDIIAAFSEADIITDRDALVRLQTGLQAKGLYTGKIDGIFDDGTRDAIHACVIRGKSATRSDASRPPILIHSGHP